MKSLAAFLVFTLSTAVWAADEEAQMKMESAARRAALRSKSSSSTANQSQPTTIKMLRAKPDAPEGLKRWVRLWPTEKSLVVTRLRTKASSLRQRASAIRSLPKPVVQNGVTPFGPTHTTDMAELNARTGVQLDLEKQAKLLDAEAAQLERDPAFFVVPEIGRLELHAFGTLSSTVRVVSLQGPKDFIGRYESSTIWVHGLDTAGFVDDHQVPILVPCAITGTRRHQTSTMFVLEPCETSKYIEVVDLDPTDPATYASPKDPKPDTVEPAEPSKGMTLAEVRKVIGTVPQLRNKDSEGRSTYSAIVNNTTEGRKDYTLQFQDGLLTSFNVNVTAPRPPGTR